MSTISATNFKHESSSVDNITLDANGNVGIGGTAPSTNKLHIEGEGATRAVVYNSTNIVGVRVQALTSSGLVQTDTNHPLQFATNNGAVQMQIDTAGRVTMPYQPMFYAQHNSTSTSSGQYGRWDNEFVNVGNHASHAAHTGSYIHTRWTAPVTGKYLVWVGNIGPNASTVQRTRIVVNGSDRSAELRTSQDAQHGTSASMMAIVSATAGDWISAYTSSDNGAIGFYSGVYSHFGVKLIG